jgi:hypothetical protein
MTNDLLGEAKSVFCQKSTALVFMLVAVAAYSAEPAQLTPEQAEVLSSARTLAMQYRHVLPDFICTQLTHRSIARTMNGNGNIATGISGRSPIASMANASGYSSDVIEEQLTYVGGNESYDVLTMNGKKVSGKDHMHLNGAISAGEFGSLLAEVFDPESRTSFTWDRIANVHGRRAWVYNFVVPKEFGTDVIARDSNREILVSTSGQVFIDPGTKEVLQIFSKLDLPLNFPIKVAQRSIEFAPRAIAGKNYSLPTRSLVHMEDSTQTYDNKIEFKNYHRFASESTLHFENQDSNSSANSH